MKILHLPTPTGGNAWGLAQAEKCLGLESTVLVAAERDLHYPADIQLGLSLGSSGWKKLWTCGRAFLKIRNQYDCFHFNFGLSLLDFHHRGYCLLDLPFYPKKAKLFVTYNGCDARQKLPTMVRREFSACHNKGCGRCDTGEYDRIRQKMIEKMSRYVSHMWAVNPDLLYFLPEDKASFLPYTVCHFDQPVIPPSLEKKIKIVHAPTDRLIKGSQYIVDAVQRLQRCYPDLIDFVLIENMPHERALLHYREADLVVDQLLVGWYGAFAVECMLMGKPIIVHIAEEDLKFIPSQMAKDLLNTVIDANPTTIYEVLERCIHDRFLLREHSQAAIDYAHKWHNPKYVASLTKEKYES